MHTIWKYSLLLTDRQVVEMPRGSKILSVAAQNNILCLWVQVDSNEPTSMGRVVNIYGTGNPIGINPGQFIGTVVMNPFVWHVFYER